MYFCIWKLQWKQVKKWQNFCTFIICFWVEFGLNCVHTYLHMMHILFYNKVMISDKKLSNVKWRNYLLKYNLLFRFYALFQIYLVLYPSSVCWDFRMRKYFLIYPSIFRHWFLNICFNFIWKIRSKTYAQLYFVPGSIPLSHSHFLRNTKIGSTAKNLRSTMRSGENFQHFSTFRASYLDIFLLNFSQKQKNIFKLLQLLAFSSISSEFYYLEDVIFHILRLKNKSAFVSLLLRIVNIAWSFKISSL